MAKIYRVIQMKLNQLVLENVRMITDLPTKRIFKRYHSDKHFSECLTKRWRQKSTGTDMEQNYVTVFLCTVTASVACQFSSARDCRLRHRKCPYEMITHLVNLAS